MLFEPFLPADLALLKPLEPEGWGNLEPRFAFFLDHDFCSPWKIRAGDQLAAVGAAILFKGSAWLACIITHPGFRHRGLGKEMTVHLAGQVKRHAVHSIQLIATDMGFPLYRQLGFELLEEYLHFARGADMAAPGEVLGLHPLEDKHLEGVLNLDRKLSGEDRRTLLWSHREDAFVYNWEDKLRGFYFPRLGEGLIVAEDAEAGLALLQHRAAGRDHAAVPLSNTAALSWLRSHGWKELRTSRRMYLGNKPDWLPTSMYNRINGQLG